MTALQYKCLPPEIWDQILSEATYYPGEFDAHEWTGGNELELARRDFASNSSANQFILYNKMKRYKANSFQFQLDTRHSLVLVCKQWYNLAIRHLYGSITIQGLEINKLASLIASTEFLGPLVKRLELKCWSYMDHQSNLESLLSNCPNIIIFYELSGYTGKPLMLWWHSLTRNPSMSAKLRHVGCVSMAVGIPGSDFLSYISSLSSLSSLVTLRLPSLLVRDPSGATSTSRIPISLPRLRILDLGSVSNYEDKSIPSWICNWNLPELYAVWVPVDNKTAFIPLTEFWRKYGKKLTTINIYNCGTNAVGLDLRDVSLGIESIGQPPSEIFPCLRQLIVLHNAMGYYPPLFLPSISLEIYEVPFHDVGPRKRGRGAVLQQLIGYHLKQLPVDKAPNLRIFRISDCPTNIDHGPLKELYADFVEQYLESIRAELEARGVTLELVELG